MNPILSPTMMEPLMKDGDSLIIVQDVIYLVIPAKDLSHYNLKQQPIVLNVITKVDIIIFLMI